MGMEKERAREGGERERGIRSERGGRVPTVQFICSPSRVETGLSESSHPLDIKRLNLLILS